MAKQPLVFFLLGTLVVSGELAAITVLEAEDQVLDKNYLYHSFIPRQEELRTRRRVLNTKLLPDVTLSHTTTRPYGVSDFKVAQQSIFEVRLTLAKSVNYAAESNGIKLDSRINSQKEVKVKYSLLHLLRSTYYELKFLDEQQRQREANLTWLKQLSNYSRSGGAGARIDRAIDLRTQLISMRQSDLVEESYFDQQRGIYALQNLLRIRPEENLVLNDVLPEQFTFPFPFEMKFTPSELMLAQLAVDKAKNDLNRIYTSQVPNFFGAYQGISHHDDSSTIKQFLVGVTWHIQPEAFYEARGKKAEILANENILDDKKEEIARSAEGVMERLKSLQSKMIRQKKIIAVQEKIVAGIFTDFKNGSTPAKSFIEDIETLFADRNLLLEQRFATVVAFSEFSRLIENSDLFYDGLGLRKK